VIDPDWDALFSGAEKVDIFVAYGRTWRNTHLPQLKEVVSNSKARLQVFLPDPQDMNTISILADRFSMKRDDLVGAILEAKEAFLGLRVPNGGEVKVYFRKGDSVFSCYRFDNHAVVTLYTHSRQRGQVPTLVCRNGGTLYDFVRQELRAIQGQSKDAETS
jgi:hypothetical protein